MYIDVPRYALKRMVGQHFPSNRTPRPGIFLPEFNFWDIFNAVLHQMKADAEAAEVAGKHKFRTTYAADSLLGWSTFIDEVDFDPEQVETFKFNKRATGLRYKLGCGPAAPLTNLVTLSVEVKQSDRFDEQVGFLCNVSLGRSLGSRRGQLSTREGVIFFHDQHQCENLV